MNDVKDEKNIHLRSVREKTAFSGNGVSKRPSDGYEYVFHYINRLLCVQDHQFSNDQNGRIRVRSIAHPILHSFVKRMANFSIHG